MDEAERMKYHVQACIRDICSRGGYWGDPDCDHEWAKPVPFQYTKCVKCGRWRWYHKNLIWRIRGLRRKGARIPEADTLVPPTKRQRA